MSVYLLTDRNHVYKSQESRKSNALHIWHPFIPVKWDNDWWDMTRRRTVRQTLGVWPSVRQVVLRDLFRCPQQINYVALGEGVKEALLTEAVLSFVCPELSGSCVRVLRIVRGP